MLRDKEGDKHKYTIKTSQRQAFMEVFNLHALEGKVNRQGLKAIFDRVGYFISPEHFEDICARAFEFKENVTFEEFMELFRVRESPHSLTDIRNAFKLLAGEEDEFIPLELLYEIYRKAGIEKERVDDLMLVLEDFVDRKAGTFNYR